MAKNVNLSKHNIEQALNSGKVGEALAKLQNTDLGSEQANRALREFDGTKFSKALNAPGSQQALQEMAKDPMMMIKMQEHLKSMKGKTHRNCKYQITKKKNKKVECGNKFIERRKSCNTCISWCDSCAINCPNCEHVVPNEEVKISDLVNDIMSSNVNDTAGSSDDINVKVDNNEEDVDESLHMK